MFHGAEDDPGYNLLAGAWLGHFARFLLLSLCHGHLRTWLYTSAMSSVGGNGLQS